MKYGFGGINFEKNELKLLNSLYAYFGYNKTNTKKKFEIQKRQAIQLSGLTEQEFDTVLSELAKKDVVTYNEDSNLIKITDNGQDIIVYAGEIDKLPDKIKDYLKALFGSTINVTFDEIGRMKDTYDFEDRYKIGALIGCNKTQTNHIFHKLNWDNLVDAEFYIVKSEGLRPISRREYTDRIKITGLGVSKIILEDRAFYDKIIKQITNANKTKLDKQTLNEDLKKTKNNFLVRIYDFFKNPDTTNVLINTKQLLLLIAFVIIVIVILIYIFVFHRTDIVDKIINETISKIPG